MQGTIFDIKRFAVHDGPGIRTTVFLKGCPLRCLWCHNPESWKPEPESAEREIRLDDRLYREKEIIGRKVTVNDLMKELEKERLVMEESQGGVTFSGGEPLMQPRFLLEMLKACQENAFHTAVDTSGFALQEDLLRIMPFTSLFLFDLKMMDMRKHEQFTGADNQLILDNFRWLMQQGKPVRVRIPVVAGYTATRDNLTATLEFLTPYAENLEQVDLLPYHRIGMHKYDKLGICCEMPGESGKPDSQEMDEIYSLFNSNGHKVTIGG
ncbi:MAG TPA: glycyl-radical enzyme activating protein [Prolixibacteraceae bacterium]|nr:glycyl-radical enzyme activating protein [Prolixibacteraceae bacterium]